LAAARAHATRSWPPSVPDGFECFAAGTRARIEPQATADLGHRLENAVFLSLRRRKKPISYAAEIHQWECDFVTDMEAIQVCADLNPRNLEREARGAIHAAALPGRSFIG